jgi:hypothetical protein
MKSLPKLSTLMICLLAFACEDPAPKKTIAEDQNLMLDQMKADTQVTDMKVVDQTVVVDQTIVVDQSLVVDQAVVVDQVVVMDQAVVMDQTIITDIALEVDQSLIVDMAMPVDMLPPVLPTTGCMTDDECTAANNRCIEGECRFDLFPKVYRLSDGEVTKPQVAGAILTTFLNLAVNQEALNLLFEPYASNRNDGRSYFFIGNGSPCGTNNCNDRQYIFRQNLPIQNFLGEWRAPLVRTPDLSEEDYQAQIHLYQEPSWYLDGINDFILSVPSGTTSDGTQCMVRFPTKVSLRITPIRDPQTQEILQIKGIAVGYLRQQDIQNIVLDFEFVPGMPVTIDFSNMYFANEILQDLDRDGILAEYPFEIKFEATNVTFIDDRVNADFSNRNPLPLYEQPLECINRMP